MKIITLFTLLMTAFILNAQDCNYYFNFKPGTVLTYQIYNQKHKPDGTLEYKVKSITKKTEGESALLETKSFDKKGELIFSTDYEILCKGNNMLIDFKSILSPQTMMAYQDMEVEIEGDYISYPDDLVVGKQLEDGTMKMNVSSNGIPIIKMSISIHDRMVAAKEDVELPAGNFTTYKITTKTTTTTFFNLETSSAEWYNPDTGLIRSESYDKKGKLVSSMELVSIK